MELINHGFAGSINEVAKALVNGKADVMLKLAFRDTARSPLDYRQAATAFYKDYHDMVVKTIGGFAGLELRMTGP
jgi:hypothetical protein